MALSLSRAFARVRRDERGFSLVEVLLVASVLAVVLGAILSLSATTAKLAPNDDERALVLEEARTGLNGMTRELREATSVGSTSDYSFQVNLGSRVITYACNVPHPSIAGRTQCTRKEGTSAAATVVDHVLNVATGTPVFSRSGNYAAVKLRVAAAGERTEGHKHTITLEDGFFMRNLP